MKTNKILKSLSVVAMLTAFVIGGSANLYAKQDLTKAKIDRIEVLVADLKLSDTQQEKYQEFRSSLQAQTGQNQGRNMEYVNKLLDIPVF